MRTEQIIDIALSSGFPYWWLFPPEPERRNTEVITMLTRFVEKVASAERESCAKPLENASRTGKITCCMSAAKAIRNKTETNLNFMSVVYRIIHTNDNQVVQKSHSSEVAAFFLGRTVSAYVVIKTDVHGHRVVDISAADCDVKKIQEILEQS